MITSRVYRDGELQAGTPFDRAASEAARSKGVRVWLDVIDPTDDELETLRQVFGLHELAIEDSRSWGQRAKVEFYPDAGHLLLVTHGLRLGQEDKLVDSEMHLFADRGLFLISVRREPLLDFGRMQDRLRAEPGPDGGGMGFQLYLLLDEIVDGYLDSVERLEDLSDDIEERVSDDDPATGANAAELAADIFRLRREVVRFRRLVAPMREVVDLLTESSGLVTPALVPYYRDVVDHVIRATELIDNVRDLLTSARELQLAQVSNRLNVVMKQVTSWAAIILIPTLIAGIYGMNFQHMPELSWKIGYPLAVGMMVLSGFVLYRVFKGRDWL
jgi:magnesium transporter